MYTPTIETCKRHMQYLNEALARRKSIYRYSIIDREDNFGVSRFTKEGEVTVLHSMPVEALYYTIKGMYQVLTDNVLAVSTVDADI